MQKIIGILVDFYQQFISPLLGRSCKYRPTCSEYTRQALKKHGLLKGTIRAIWRILRCNPFSSGGWDPVDEDDCPRDG